MPSTASACHRRATVLALAISTALLPMAWVPSAQAQAAVAAPLRSYAIRNNRWPMPCAALAARPMCRWYSVVTWWKGVVPAR